MISCSTAECKREFIIYTNIYFNIIFIIVIRIRLTNLNILNQMLININQ